MEKYNLSCWTYFPISASRDKLAKDYCDLGLNAPMTPVFSEGDNPSDMIRLLDEFHKLGSQAIVYDDRVTAKAGNHIDEEEYRKLFKVSLEQFGSHPAVKGFYVGDEPDAPDASYFFQVARIQREMAPDLLPFLNLLPWFDLLAERIGAEAYGPYLDRAVEEGNLKLLCYDCYTQMWEGDRGYDVYFNNLREMRDASKRHQISFGTTLLSSGHYDYMCPNQNDFRWQISTAAALGAKFLSYFYVTTDAYEHNYRNFPVNMFGERTEVFGWLSEENRVFLARYADLLLELTCEKSEFTEKSYGRIPMFQADATLLEAGNVKDINMLVSTFVDEEGVRYRVIVNMDREKNIAAHLCFAPNVQLEQLLFNREWKLCSQYTDAVGAMSNDGASVTLWMAPGQMEILREK